MCENKVLLRSKQGILIGVFYVFLPKIGAISAFLTTIWVEMMMIEIFFPNMLQWGSGSQCLVQVALMFINHVNSN